MSTLAHAAGRLSLLSSGFMRVASDPQAASQYLARCCGGRLAPALTDAFARQMDELPDTLFRLAAPLGASVSVRFGTDQPAYETSDLYDWPGHDAIGWAGIEEVPGFTGYPWASPGKGHLLMRMLSDAVERRPIEVWFDAPATDLLIEDSHVVGVQVRRKGEVAAVRSSAVILTTGGFEFDAELLADSLSVPTIHPIGHRPNTGDGIRLAQQSGAALWHMWHVHASYGFRPPGRSVAMRNHLGGSRRPERSVAWILVDQQGRRFMNEAPPAPQDTPWRALAAVDVETGRCDRIPCWLVFDDEGRRQGPIGRAAWSSPEDRYDWSTDNQAEIDRGWIRVAPTPEGLAHQVGLDPSALAATIHEWNTAVHQESDPLGRPSGSMVPLQTPPYYAIETWPVLSNTQGGPRHDELQQVLDGAGRAMPGLLAAGELGSIFGHLYLLGGNLTEAVMGGRAAGLTATTDLAQELA